MLQDDNYEKTGRTKRGFRAVGARDQVAVLIWVVEIGLFEKGREQRLREVNEGAMWLSWGKDIMAEVWPGSFQGQEGVCDEVRPG